MKPTMKVTKYLVATLLAFSLCVSSVFATSDVNYTITTDSPWKAVLSMNCSSNYVASMFLDSGATYEISGKPTLSAISDLGNNSSYRMPLLYLLPGPQDSESNAYSNDCKWTLRTGNDFIFDIYIPTQFAFGSRDFEGGFTFNDSTPNYDYFRFYSYASDSYFHVYTPSQHWRFSSNGTIRAYNSTSPQATYSDYSNNPRINFSFNTGYSGNVSCSGYIDYSSGSFIHLYYTLSTANASVAFQTYQFNRSSSGMYFDVNYYGFVNDSGSSSSGSGSMSQDYSNVLFAIRNDLDNISYYCNHTLEQLTTMSRQIDYLHNSVNRIHSDLDLLTNYFIEVIASIPVSSTDSGYGYFTIPDLSVKRYYSQSHVFFYPNTSRQISGPPSEVVPTLSYDGFYFVNHYSVNNPTSSSPEVISITNLVLYNYRHKDSFGLPDFDITHFINDPSDFDNGHRLIDSYEDRLFNYYYTGVRDFDPNGRPNFMEDLASGSSVVNELADTFFGHDDVSYLPFVILFISICFVLFGVI